MAGEPKRILIVDDDAETRTLLRLALSGNGVDIVEAGDGQEAFWLAEHGPRPDAIILDLMMPGMDGWQTLHALKADAGLRYVPVLVVSGVPERDLERARRWAQGVLAKPFTAEALRGEVARLLDDA